ncbi:hypothetical protein SDC9_141943 [bioreactor metagenome]|uniref:Uncharacterized protein n=1 Tax=bioreactor metagenome TaxID=1076179 RepID=A0A645DZR6_9ZZZZ
MRAGQHQCHVDAAALGMNANRGTRRLRKKMVGVQKTRVEAGVHSRRHAAQACMQQHMLRLIQGFDMHLKVVEHQATISIVVQLQVWQPYLGP